MAEKHEHKEVNDHRSKLQALQGTLGLEYATWGRLVDDGYMAGEGEKVVFFIRHGEGRHNVAQREWRAAKKASEPYTVANDPNYDYVDAELTETGRAQAAALKPRFEAMAVKPELVVVSPMRRATQTALGAGLATLAPAPTLLALEACHETGGRHTCDKRLSVPALKKYFPQVDYSQILTEEDPLWHDETRESLQSIATRAGAFLEWLRNRTETRIAVAAHSGFLLALFNAVLNTTEDEASTWFATGECRAVALTWQKQD